MTFSHLWNAFRMRGSVVQIVLLFFLSSGMAQTLDPSIAAIWNELKMLREMVHDLGTMVVEQRVELRSLETRVKDTELQVEEERGKVLLLTAELGDNRAELVVAKNKMVELEKENAVLSHRVAASEKDLDNQSRDVAALRKTLSTTETQMLLQKIIIEDLEKAKTEQETRLNTVDIRTTANEKEAEEQKVEVAALRANLNLKATAGKIAFSVGLTGTVGPYETETQLKYNKIFTNIGNAYNPTLGTFIAPVRGVYYFRFTAFDYRSEITFGLYLFHNSQIIMANADYNFDMDYVYLSNALTLQLDEGDLVYMHLPSGHSLYEDGNNHNTFSGFLLFSL